jgi:hypothetical protein
MTEKQHTRSRKRTGRNGSDEAEVCKEQRDGNPRFLEGALRCVELRCRILRFIDKQKDEDKNAGQATAQDGDLRLTLEQYIELEPPHGLQGPRRGQRQRGFAVTQAAIKFDADGGGCGFR